MRQEVRSAGPKWHARGTNNALIFNLTYQGVTHFPRALSHGIGYIGTRIAYHLMRGGTRALKENLRVVRPDAPAAEINRLALLTYRSYARDTIDFLRSLEMPLPALAKMIAVLDRRRFDELQAEGRGIIVVGGHFGNWEMGGVALRRLHNVPVTLVVRPEASAAIGNLRRRMRDSVGIDTIEIGHMMDTALRIRRLLESNGIVAMLLDRHLGRDRVDVTMFGRRTGFLRTPAMMALLSGAPLLPSYMIRSPDGRFEGSCGDPIRVDPSLPTDDAVRLATQAFATQLEARIREKPYLWYQFYSYWSDRP